MSGRLSCRRRASGCDSSDGQRKRALRALAVVAVLILAVPASGCAAGILQSGIVQEVAFVEASVPEGFEEEVLSLASRGDVRVGADGAVVGFCCSGDAPAALAEVAVELAEKGWMRVESGSDAAASFVKREGHYRWLFVSCTEVSGEVSVVVTSDGCAKEDE